MQPITHAQNRIGFLDGLRGIAILLVALYHAYSRYPEIVPYLTESYGQFPVFKYGFWGVQLFFLICGFVTLMTLEKRKCFFQFIGKQWLRLFPAMIIATVFIFATVWIFHERPLGIPHLIDALPGLTFIEPSWLSTILRVEINPLETVFWTLYVQVKFYIFFGLLYFWLGKKKAVGGLLILFVFTFAMNMLNSVGVLGSWLGGSISFLAELTMQLGFGHFAWFAIGAWGYLYYTERKSKYLVYIGVLLSVASIAMGSDWIEIVCLIATMSLFLMPLCVEKIRCIFCNKVFAFLGFVSYPLFLIHSNANISIIIKLREQFPIIPTVLLPVIPMCIMIFISFLIAKYTEPFLRTAIQRLIPAGKKGIVKK